MENFRPGLQYSEHVRNAVRYGYQYRKEVEKDKEISVDYSLGDASEVLLYIAQIIMGGVTWDLIKTGCREMYKRLKKSNQQIDEETESVLVDEKELHDFYEYIVEFDSMSMSVTCEQRKYIREEIVADYYGREITKIYTTKNRLPNIDEYKQIHKEAEAYADNILGSNNQSFQKEHESTPKQHKS